MSLNNLYGSSRNTYVATASIQKFYYYKSQWEGNKFIIMMERSVVCFNNKSQIQSFYVLIFFLPTDSGLVKYLVNKNRP